MADGIEVLQDVLVLSVAVHGTTVVADVYGSPANVCAAPYASTCPTRPAAGPRWASSPGGSGAARRSR